VRSATIEVKTLAITVRIPTPLRRITGGEAKVDVNGANLQGIVDALESAHPGIKERICGEDGEIRHFVNVYVNGEDVRYMDGLGTETKSGDEISIVPAVAGGC
jgi:molybdopterin synthase sulfur carrier subunit